MLKTYESIAAITGEAAAKELIKILVDVFGWYISTEELQQLNI